MFTGFLFQMMINSIANIIYVLKKLHTYYVTDEIVIDAIIRKFVKLALYGICLI